MSPNSLLQSCLGFAVRSAKQMGHRKRPGARSLVRRASEHGRMGEREMQPHPDSEGTRAELVILCLPLRFGFVLVAFMLLSCSRVIAVDQMARQLWCFKVCYNVGFGTEEAMTTHPNILAWKFPGAEEPSRLQYTGSHRTDFTFTFHFHALKKKMATHPTLLAGRIPGRGEPGGLPSIGSHRVGHD